MGPKVHICASQGSQEANHINLADAMNVGTQ